MAMISAKKRNGVAEKGRGRAPPRDEQAGDRRADQTRAVENRTVQRDGRGDLVLLHQLWDERGDRRHFERDADAEHSREHDDVPDLDAPGQNEEPEGRTRGTICTTCVAIRILRLS